MTQEEQRRKIIAALLCFVLDTSAGWALADRLEEDESRSGALWRCRSELTSPPFCQIL